MGVFSDNYFDLLSEANAIKKGNKGDELWSEITNVIIQITVFLLCILLYKKYATK